MPSFLETSGAKERLRILSQSIKQIFAHELSQRPTKNTRLSRRLFYKRAVQVALPLCTPAESQNRTTVVADYRNLTINITPSVWAIIIFIQCLISNLSCRSFYVFYVILSLSQRLSQRHSSKTLMHTTGSAHVNDVDIVKYKRNIVIIIVFLGMIRVLSNRPQTMTPFGCDPLHPYANPGYPQQFTE